MTQRWFRRMRIVVVCLASTVTPALSQEKNPELTLQQAIALALDQNAQILQARESIAGAAAKVSESKSAGYPVVNTQASYNRMGPIGEFTVSMGPTIPPITMKFGIENAYNVGMNVQHSLFNWGRTQAGIDISDAGLRLSETSLELARQSAAYQVVQLFYGILVSKEALDVLNQSISLLESRLTSVKARYDSGLASNFDVLTIEVQIATVKARRVDTESNLQKLKLFFNKFTGRDLNAPVLLKGSLHYQSPATDRESLVRTAGSNRKELEQLKHQEAMSLAQKDLSRSLDKPNVNLSLAWGLRNGIMPNLDVMRGNWNAGIVLAYPLFDGFKTKSQAEQADVNLHLARMRYDDAKNSISMEVNQALVDIQANEEKIRIEEVKVRQSEQALKIADERHVKGFLSTMDLLDSQSSLDSARLNLLQAVYSAIMSKYNLEKTMGVALY
jgi:outer membrane protein